MRYYISDLHFYHANMNTRMDKRGFESVEAMNEYMISRWNKKVRKNDEVIILGDFSFDKGEKTNELLRRLNGRKYLVIGNHDRFLDDKALRPIPCNMINCFSMFSDYMPLTLDEWIEIDKKRRASIPKLGDYQDDWMDDLEES